MATRNLSVTYGAADTLTTIAEKVRDAFVTDLNWVLVEDEVAGSDSFTVRAHSAVGNVNDRILLWIRTVSSPSDLLVVTVCEGWTSGTPGSPDWTTRVTDIGWSPVAGWGNRFLPLDIGSGGTIFVDSDDAAAEHVAVTHRDSVGTFADTAVLIATCGIKLPDVPNYGALAWHNASSTKYLNSGNVCFWIPPRNHGGTPSNTHQPAYTTEPAAYWCMAPCSDSGTSSGDAATLAAGPWIDSALNTRMMWPLSIIMSYRGAGDRPAGSAYGYRGRLQGIMGFGRGLTPRTPLTDVTTGTKIVAINTRPSEGNPLTPALLYAVPAE